MLSSAVSMNRMMASSGSPATLRKIGSAESNSAASLIALPVSAEPRCARQWAFR